MLNREILEKISQNPNRWLTELGISLVYFNSDYPCNNIVLFNDPKGEICVYFNGKQWKATIISFIVEMLIENLVACINRAFSLFPNDDKHIISIYENYANYVGDYIDDSNEFKLHMDKAIHHIKQNITTATATTVIS